MQFKWLDHAVIVVRTLEAATRDYEKLFGIPATEPGKEFPDMGFRDSRFHLGTPDRFVELIQPTDPSKQAGRTMQRTLDERGEGLHNIALAVESVDAAVAAAKKRGSPSS